MTDDSVIAHFPTPDRIDRLIAFHEGSARRDGGLVLGLEAEGLTEAARRNRVRAEAYRETVQLLRLLRGQLFPEPREFRGHLEPKEQTKARIRAPP